MHEPAKASSAPPALERSLGVFSATTLVVGSMIGSGIFIAPSLMAGQLASPGVILMLWLVGGVLTLLGALAYGELCALLPQAGGQYAFLREAFGPRVGFLYGWTSFLIIQTGTQAAVALGFAKFLSMAGLPIGERMHVVTLLGLPLSRAQLVAAAVIVLLTLVNCRGVREGAFIQNVSTVLKVGAIVLLVVVGLSLGKGSLENLRPFWSTETGRDAVGVTFLAALGVAMSKALFAYDAWNTVTFTAEEIRQPERNLPRALFWGTLVTTIVYVSVSALYFAVVPASSAAAVPENLIVAEVARVLFGPSGRMVVAVAILISTFGCLNGLILGGARVLFAMARDGLFFPVCARVHWRYHTPIGALVLQGLWAIVLAGSGNYSRLLTYVMFASLGFNVLTVLALFRVRRMRGATRRGTWGYPVTPLLNVLGTGFFMVYIVAGEPRDSLYGVAIVLLGLPAYLVFERRLRRRTA